VFLALAIRNGANAIAVLLGEAEPAGGRIGVAAATAATFRLGLFGLHFEPPARAVGAATGGKAKP
jgi:hypothetical protein